MTTRGQISFVSRSIYDASPVTLSLRAHLYITPEEGVFHLVDLHQVQLVEKAAFFFAIQG